MRKSKGSLALYILLAVTIVALASCTQAVAPNGASNLKTGTISYAVAPFNPVVTAAYGRAHLVDPAKAASSSRAFMSAAKVKFTVYDYTTWTVADTWIDYPAVTHQAPGSSASYGTRSLPVGTYYMYAYVYSDANASEYNYTVMGSKYFSVTSGQTAATNPQTVICSPNSYNYLYAGSPYSVSTATPWAFNASGVPTTIGAETWFYVSPSTSLTSFTVTPDSGSKAIPYVFVFDGATGDLAKVNAVDAFAFASSAGGTAQLSGVVTSPYYSYYVCVIDAGSAADTNRGYSMSYSAYVPPPTATTMIAIATSTTTTPATWVTGTITDSSIPLWYVFNTTPGQTYNIWVNNGPYNSTYYGGGDQSSTNFVGVSVYKKDYSSAYLDPTGYSLIWLYSGYSSPIVVTATEDKVYLKIESWSSGSGVNYDGKGTFGINATYISAPVTYGRATDSGGSPSAYSGYLMGPKITVATAGTLVKFGFIPRSASGNVTFALYKANGLMASQWDSSTQTYRDINNAPGDLVAWTSSTAMTTANSNMEIAPTTTVSLAAGDYWILANYDNYTTVSGTYNYDGTVIYGGWSYGTAPPTAFSGTSYQSYWNPGPNYDYYLKVQP